jgi:hypothetical protein
MSNENPTPNFRMTKEERIARLKEVKAPASIIAEEEASKVKSRPVYSDPDQVFDMAHRPYKLIKTFNVGMDILLKVYEYEKLTPSGYPDFRLDVIDPDGLVDIGRITNGPVQFITNGDWMVDVSSSVITSDDVFVKATLEAEVVEV